MNKELILQGIQKAQQIAPELWGRACYIVRIDGFIKIGLTLLYFIILGIMALIAIKIWRKIDERDWIGGVGITMLLGGFLLSILFSVVIYNIGLQIFLPDYWIVLRIIGK